MALAADLSFSTDNLKTDKMRTFCTQKQQQQQQQKPNIQTTKKPKPKNTS